jgi:hypothetical protein
MISSENSEAWVGVTAAMELFNAFQTTAAALAHYINGYTIPFITAVNYFNQVERERLWSRTLDENLSAYLRLGRMNMELAGRAFNADMRAIDHFLDMALQVRLSDPDGGKTEACAAIARHMHRMATLLTYDFPAAIRAVESEFGFHFERQPASSRIDETDRFILYQVLPTDPKVKPREKGKPILIIPPFVLGANILAFLPMEKRSYAHAFANQGIPTYVRVLKDIQTSEALQLMEPEDDARDMRRFCEAIKARHGLPLTLNGYCQGGYAALCNLLSGELDGLVDAFITCVSPMDGSRSRGFAQFLKALPQVFNDLAYGTKTLRNGNQVADGNLMGWVYKLKNVDTESPLLAMWRDMMMVAKSDGDAAKINKTAAALNYWLIYDRNDLPLKMTRVSFDSYNTPITPDGTLPVKLFGRSLNLKRIQEKKIPWLICYGKQDDLVEPASALAPTDYVDAEVTGFPKGHVAIATSWSQPNSTYALHLRYPDENTRGPVRFQLDLQEEIERASAPPPKAASAPGANQSDQLEAKPATPEAKPATPTKSATPKTKPATRPKRTKASQRPKKNKPTVSTP